MTARNNTSVLAAVSRRHSLSDVVWNGPVSNTMFWTISRVCRVIDSKHPRKSRYRWYAILTRVTSKNPIMVLIKPCEVPEMDISRPRLSYKYWTNTAMAKFRRQYGSACSGQRTEGRGRASPRQIEESNQPGSHNSRAGSVRDENKRK